MATKRVSIKVRNAHAEHPKEERVVKLLLPVTLIRAMDEVIVNGVGGFSTRNEFVREAVESYLLELTHELAPEEPVEIKGRPRLRSLPGTRRREEPAHGEGAPADEIDLADTALPHPDEGPTLTGEVDVVAEPLFGMHNRDYPSLWAASRLAAYIAGGALTFDEFAERATEDAWTYADSLRSLEGPLHPKPTALFPTNEDKREAASSAFRVFAIGSINVADHGLRAEGPLFLWRVIDVERRGGAVVVGLRPEGRYLLGQLAGLTVDQPHPEEAARIFLAHLRQYASADYWGFDYVITMVSQSPTRIELLDAVQRARPEWRESVAATNAQGYVARAREWGLVAPKVIDGRYELTEFGREVLRGGGNE